MDSVTGKTDFRIFWRRISYLLTHTSCVVLSTLLVHVYQLGFVHRHFARQSWSMTSSGLPYTVAIWLEKWGVQSQCWRWVWTVKSKGGRWRRAVPLPSEGLGLRSRKISKLMFVQMQFWAYFYSYVNVQYNTWLSSSIGCPTITKIPIGQILGCSYTRTPQACHLCKCRIMCVYMFKRLSIYNAVSRISLNAWKAK